VTRRRELRERLATLGEIRDIMGAMKNLAFAEHRRLGRSLAAQRQVVAGMEAAAGDLLAFHPQPEPDPEALTPVLLVVGAERGFCGDFNEVLVHRAARAAEAAGPDGPALVGVGYKLGLRLEGAPGVAAVLDGPAAAGEVEAAIGRVAGALRELEGRLGPLAVSVLHHDSEGGAPEPRPLFPPFHPPPPPPTSPNGPDTCPPRLNLAPADLFRRLVDQYLLAALEAVFLESLLAENEHRMRHLDGAVHRLDERRREMTLKANLMRQEEITEEIEMILLNVEAGA
jgi:F-type H+-transporting ATPase subunit gamma